MKSKRQFNSAEKLDFTAVTLRMRANDIKALSKAKKIESMTEYVMERVDSKTVILRKK